MWRAWRRRLLIVATLYFTFLGGTFITDHRYWPRVAHHVIVTVLMLGWGLARLRRPRKLPATALDAPLAAFLLANALATLLAVDARISAEFLWRLGVHLWLYYAIADLLAQGHRRDVFEALFLASGVVVLVGVFEFASWYFGLSWVLPFGQSWLRIGGLAHPIPPRIHRLNFTLGFSTGLSAYLATLIPVGLAFALTGRQRDTRRAFWLWLAGALVIEVLSFSRGGLLSLAVSLPTFGALSLLGDPERRAHLLKQVRGPRALVGIVVVLVIGVVVAFGWTRQALTGHRAGDVVRLELWRSAWVIFKDHPLTGVGPYGFGRAFRAVRDPSIAAFVIGDRHLTADSRLLTTLAESGLVGGLALVWLAGRFLQVGYRRWRAASGPDRLRMAAACAAVIGFGVHNLVDAFTATPVLLPMLVLTAFVVQGRMGDRSPNRRGTARDRRKSRLRGRAPTSDGRRRLVLGVFLALVVLSGAGWFVSDRAQFHFEQSLALAGRSDLPGALAEAERAEGIDPALGLYAFQRAYLLGRLAVDDPTRLDAAIDSYEAALAREGTYDLHHANLAALYAQVGDAAGALSEMEEAADILPGSASYAFWAGRYAEAAGEDGAALRWYTLALEREPEWVGSDYWEGTALRREFLDGYLAENGDDPLLLLAADREEAALRAARAGAQTRPDDLAAQLVAGEVALRVGEADEALVALDRALALDPASARAYALRAEAKLDTGDTQGAERDARTALFLESPGGWRANYVLARLAEAQGDVQGAEAGYIASGPATVISLGWDVAVYGRKAGFRPLPWLETPGPGSFALAPWHALADLYDSQGRPDDAQAVRELIASYDTFSSQ